MAPGAQQLDVEVGNSDTKVEPRPPEAPKPEEVTSVTQAFWNHLNDFVHLPVIEYVFNNCLWSSQLLMGPVYFLLYQLLALHDFVTGYVWWRYQEPTKQPIVITGCDTGFGNSLAVSLYEKGWTVYATCLTDAGMARISEKGTADRLIPVKLDVTKAEQIDALVARVEAAHPEGIYALVNNAGLNVLGITDWVPMEDIRYIMEVNYFSVVAMCKAFMPLIKKNKGSRVVNVVSMAGLTGGIPGMSSYSASKHACAVFTAALRVELRPWGVKVSAVCPSFHRTNILLHGEDMMIKRFQALTPEKQKEYGPEYLEEWQKYIKKFMNGGWDPRHVVTAITHATTGTQPRPLYVIGLDAKVNFSLVDLLPVRVKEAIVIQHGFKNMVPAATKTH